MYMHTKYGSRRTQCHLSQLGVSSPQHNVIRAIAILVTTAILLNAMMPTLAHAATYLQGTEVNASTLVQDAYVAVTYYDSKGKQKLAKGWIDAIDEPTFQIRSRAIFGKETIAYDKVLSVIMSDESTTPIKQINEVDRFMRDMRKQEGIDTEQAIQKLSQTVTVMARGQIDHSKITKGRYIHVVYTSNGVKETATVYSADRDSSHILIREGLLKVRKIAYHNIDTLLVAKNWRSIERYQKSGAKYDVRVRVQAPSVSKKWIVGKLINMAQDTLIIQRGHSFYPVPVSSISNLEVPIKGNRNTGKGMAIGLGVGSAIYLAAYMSADNPESWDGIGLALVGMGISIPICILSTLIGAMTKSDKWVEVPPQRLNLSLAPLPAWPRHAGTSSKGLRAALTFNF
ncbi:MAG: hypothetical protein OXG87_05315 [Gemmatimonadetes bacterium]|nr:hypothetical protein [Gemmatimonadota bacterium]